MKEGSDTEFDEVLGPLFSPQILPEGFNLSSSSMNGYLYLKAVNIIYSHLQSFGYTSNWLPEVYNARLS
jgi:hypothetical protein